VHSYDLTKNNMPDMRVAFKNKTPEKQERKLQSEVSHMHLGV